MIIFGQEITPTQSDQLGPFYISHTPVVEDLNRFGKSGEKMQIIGQIHSAHPPYAPIANAKVEIWQTDGRGQVDRSTTPAVFHAPTIYLQ